MRATSARAAAVAGSALAMLATGLVWTSGPAQAAVPGINGVLACSSDRDGDSEIFTFDPTGTEKNVTQLTHNTAFDSRPRYSPDGRQIAFESNRDGPTEIYIMNADGSNVRRLTFTGVQGAHGNSSAAWTPGGDQIYYQSTRDGGGTGAARFEVYRINIDGTGDQRLTFNSVEDSLPAPSPKGDRIAFSSRRLDPLADIHLMNPDGSNVTHIPNQSSAEDSWPSWSPDGSMIAFHSRRDDGVGEEIYRMNADGTNVVRLTVNAPGNFDGFDIFPAWSPDGKRIAWNSGRAGPSGGPFSFGEVYTMDASDGGNIIRVTSNAATDQRCDWQPVCTIYGSGNITGTSGDDIICGSDGPDAISGEGGNDRILGLGGNDRIAGGPGDDEIFGGIGHDTISGDGGTDRADGGIYSADRCVAEIVQACP